MDIYRKLSALKQAWFRKSFFSYWKRLFCLFAIPFLLITILLSGFDGVKRNMYQQNTRTQEFFEVYYNFNSIFDEINKNYINLIAQSEFEDYVTNINKEYVVVNNTRNNLVKLFENSIVSMHYIDAIHFYCFDNNYVISTKNGNSIDDFYNTKFYDKYLENGKPISVTFEEGNNFLKIPETLNLCYGYYLGTNLKGLLVYSLNTNILNQALNSNFRQEECNIVLTDFEEFLYTSFEGVGSIEKYKEIADSMEYSDENDINIQSTTDEYCFKLLHKSIPLSLLYFGANTTDGRLFNIWFLLLMVTLVNIIVALASFMLTWQLREQLVSITIEFMEQFSLNGNLGSDFAIVSRNIFNNLPKGEKMELAFSRQMLDLRKNQLYALQLQLSPHFLYNTLNSINLMVMNLTKGDNTISNLIVLLSELLHDVLDTQNYIVTFRKEFEYSRKFLEIENIKRKNSVSIMWDIDKDLLDCAIIKFTLQPILENIFRHAFRSQQSQKLINIRAYNYENGFCVDVEDNGKGIDEEKLCDIRKALVGEAFDSKHIGLVNTNKRIQMLFGDEYGIKISSIPDKGTAVNVYLPKINKNV